MHRAVIAAIGAVVMTAETDFVRELTTFRAEAEEAIFCHYAWQALTVLPMHERDLYGAYHQAPIFWETMRNALRTTCIIALGRVFDQDTKTHNIDRLLRTAQKNLEVFSKEAFERRRRRFVSEGLGWASRLNDPYIPTPNDFRRLRKHVAQRRKVYETIYRDLRHKVFAHKQALSRDELRAQSARIRTGDLDRLLVFLKRLHQALWYLFNAGQKPVLPPVRYSLSEMRKRPSPGPAPPIHEAVTREVEWVLRALAASRHRQRGVETAKNSSGTR